MKTIYAYADEQEKRFEDLEKSTTRLRQSEKHS